MNFKNTPQRYGLVTKFFHWTIFLLFVLQFTLGFAIMGKVLGENLDPAQLPWINLHITTGLLILILAVLRIIWRRTTPLPDWAPTLTTHERKLSHWIEQGLYTIMILKPLSGIALVMANGQNVLWYGLLTLPGFIGRSQTLVDIFLVIHIITGLLFFLLWFTHIGLVLKHQLVNRDRLLNRMLPFTHQ